MSAQRELAVMTFSRARNAAGGMQAHDDSWWHLPLLECCLRSASPLPSVRHGDSPGISNAERRLTGLWHKPDGIGRGIPTPSIGLDNVTAECEAACYLYHHHTQPPPKDSFRPRPDFQHAEPAPGRGAACAHGHHSVARHSQVQALYEYSKI